MFVGPGSAIRDVKIFAAMDLFVMSRRYRGQVIAKKGVNERMNSGQQFLLTGGSNA